MSARRLLFLIASYAALALLAEAFLGQPVAPCLGLGDNTACYEAWTADPLIAVSRSPLPWLALFAIPSLLTIALWAQRK